MQTNKIPIDNNGKGREQVLKETNKFVEYNEIDKRTAFHIQLLAEETLGMVAAITEDFEGLFWLEDEDNLVRLHLVVETVMDYYKKKELLGVSASGKNAASRGFMSKIGDLIENAFYNVNEVNNLEMEYGVGPLMYGTMGMWDIEGAAPNSMVYMWSMKEYQDTLEKTKGEDQEAEKAWDELEKSIVASIADDVKVGIKGDKVELIIEKKL